MTHTYVILRLSAEVFDEIKSKLVEAGYQHTFHEDPDDRHKIVIDMHGIAVGAPE